MKVYITSKELPLQAKAFLSRRGRLICVPPNPALPPPEQCHADMQLTKIDHKTLVYAPGTGCIQMLEDAGLCLIPGNTPLGSIYPANIPYNLLKAGTAYFHHTDHTDSHVRTLLTQKGFPLYSVRQGYAGCSSITVPLSDGKMLVLSSDPGVLSAIGTLQLRELTGEYFTGTKEILLAGYRHGLIGGCCGFDRELGLLVCGNADRQLKQLSAQYGFPVLSIYDGPLTDIGGILVMYPDQ